MKFKYLQLKRIQTFLLGFLIIVSIFVISVMVKNILVNHNQSLLNTNTPKQTSNATVESVEKKATVSAKPKDTGGYYPTPSLYQLRVPILYYHYIGNNPNPADLQRNALSIAPDKFDEQMGYLKDNGYTTISLDTLYAALKKQTTIPSKSVILTFDDGYIDFYYNAYPILKKYGLSATEFIPTGLIGQGAYLTWPQIQEMSSSGLILFGAHSVHHYSLISVPTSTLINEITESKRILQEELGVPINFMAYPYGSTNSQVISEVIKAGFIGAIGTWSNKNQSEGTIFNMPRIRISGSINLATFASLL